MAIFLICEGENNGLDNQVLDALVIQHHNLTVQMAPSGGSGGISDWQSLVAVCPALFGDTVAFIELT